MSDAPLVVVSVRASGKKGDDDDTDKQEVKGPGDNETYFYTRLGKKALDALRMPKLCRHITRGVDVWRLVAQSRRHDFSDCYCAHHCPNSLGYCFMYIGRQEFLDAYPGQGWSRSCCGSDSCLACSGLNLQ